MVRAIAVIACAAPALAFVPTAPVPARSTVRMAAENKQQPLGALARGLATATTLLSFGLGPLAVPAANAKSGEGPKYSVFGIGGDALSSPFAVDVETFSPYSPYGTGKDALYTPLSAADLARYKNQLGKAEKRFQKIDKFISKKQWEEIRSVLTVDGPELRSSIQKLAENKGTKEAKDAANKLFEDLEAISVNSRRKEGAAAASAFSAAKASWDSFNKII